MAQINICQSKCSQKCLLQKKITNKNKTHENNGFHIMHLLWKIIQPVCLHNQNYTICLISFLVLCIFASINGDGSINYVHVSWLSVTLLVDNN